jgi:hypothetical protein
MSLKIIKDVQAQKQKVRARSKAWYLSNRTKKLEMGRANERSYSGKINRLYIGMRNRTSENGDKWITGTKLIDKNEFIRFAKTSKEFNSLFKLWVASGYLKGKTPTIDRINNNKGYVKGNLQFMDQRSNAGKRDRSNYTLNPKSQYTGVTKRPKTGRWECRIYLNNQAIHAGSFKTELEAAKAVNAKCIELGIPIRNPGIED